MKAGLTGSLKNNDDLENMKRMLIAMAAAALMMSCSVDPQGGKEEETPKEYEYMVATLNIDTENAEPVIEKKKKINCTVTIDHPNDAWDLTATGTVRGRGNSTWLWYDKKPYRFKLDEKASVLGLDPEKDWVLLANYRDPSHLMNTFVFELGRTMGMPYTNHSRYVELTMNGEYLGLYQLTEQVEQGGNRVDVDDIDGVLISLDADDGPDLSPDAGDNFWSKIYGMPVCVKHPEDDMTPARYTAIRNDFAKLEASILAIRKRTGTLEQVKELMDVQSFIDFLIIQELVYNVELAAPRSMYMHKDKDGKWAMGPLWDFDAGFDFDWGTMYSGHHYFESYKDLVLGTDPIHHTGGYWVPEFFTDIFRSDEFRQAYRERWAEISPLIMTEVWGRVSKYAEHAKDALNRNAAKWPIYFPSDDNPQTEISWEDELDKMAVWLTQRIDYLTPVINKYKE